MLHVTAVRPPSGLNANSAVLVAAKGLTNSSLIRTSSFGRLSVIVMRPSPTLPLPDHASQLWKSFTWANTAAAGAAIVVLRVIWNSEGCRAASTATTATTSATTTASPTRIFNAGRAASDHRPRTPGAAPPPAAPKPEGRYLGSP